MDILKTFETIEKSQINPKAKADAFVTAFKKLPRHDLNAYKDAVKWLLDWLEKNPSGDAVTVRILYCCVYEKYIVADYEAIFKLSLKANALVLKGDDTYYLGLIHRLLAYTYYVIGLIDHAVEYANKALDVFLGLSDEPERIRAYMALGIVYSLVDAFQTQIKYFERGLSLAKKINDFGLIKLLLNNMAYTAVLMGDYDKAAAYIEEAFLYAQPDDMSLAFVGLNINKTRLALGTNRLDDALKFWQFTFELPSLKGDQSLVMDMHLLASDIHRGFGEISLCKKHLEEGLTVAKSIQSQKYVALFSKNLSHYYEGISDYETAFAHQRAYLLAQEATEKQKSNMHYLMLRIQNEMDQLEKETYELSKALDKATHELRGTQEVTIYTLATLAEFRDQVTGNHILRMSHYVRKFCEKLVEEGHFKTALTPKFIEDFSRSSSLHDIGKVGISDLILNKPGKLTLEEFEVIKKHTVYGKEALAITEKILGEDSFLKMAQIIAYTHHEKWDGSGYPEGLSGENIPLIGRIMGLIDVYDALISKRAYKAPFTHVKAVQIIKEGIGSHFDPTLCQVFLKHHLAFHDIAKSLLDVPEELETLSLGLNDFVL